MHGPLYHCAALPLADGSIINPGNWGRLIRLQEVNNGQVPIYALNEMVLEAMRLAVAPDKPSRLNCVFALPDLGAAVTYRNKYARNTIIYQVSAVEGSTQVHLGEYEAISQAHNGQFFDQAMERYRHYWLNPDPVNVEILLPCPVRILNRVAD